MLSACFFSPLDLILFASEGPPPGGVDYFKNDYFLSLLHLLKWLFDEMNSQIIFFEISAFRSNMLRDQMSISLHEIWPRYWSKYGQNTYQTCVWNFSKKCQTEWVKLTHFSLGQIRVKIERLLQL